MPWPIRYHEERPENPQVGDMWPAPWLVYGDEGGPREFFLADRYLKAWAAGGHRLPLVVRLPGQAGDFCVDGPDYDNGVRGTFGWEVTGEPPRLTVRPSIHLPGYYHGYITDGVISDDVDGRKL